MSATTTKYGTYYDPDPAPGGFTDKDGAFKSYAELASLARAVLARRPDGRSPRDVLSEALDDEQAIDLLIDGVFQPEDIASWAFDTDTGLWESA